MAQVEQIQVNVAINGDKARAELNKLDAEALAIRDSLKGMTKGTEEYIKASDDLKKVNDKQKELQNSLGLSGKSLKELQKESKALSRELNNLTPGTAEFIRVSGKLRDVNDRYAELRKEIRGTQDATANLNDKLKEINPFQGQLSSLASGTKAWTMAIQGSTKGMNLLKVAIASTGIGLLIIALGTLISYFTTTQEGIDKVNSVLRPMQVLFERLKGVVQEFGKALLSPKQLLQDFFNILRDPMGSFKKTKEFFEESIAQGKELDEQIKAITKAEIDLTIANASLRVEFEKQKSAATDVENSLYARAEAAKAAMLAQDQLLENEQKMMQMRIDLMALEQSFNDTLDEGKLEMAKLMAEKVSLEMEHTRKVAEARNMLNALNAQILKEREEQERWAREKELMANTEYYVQKENQAVVAELSLSERLDAIRQMEVEKARMHFQALLAEQALKEQQETDMAMRTAQAINMVQDIKADAMRNTLSQTAQFLSQDENMRKKHGALLKAFAIAEVMVGLQQDLQNNQVTFSAMTKGLAGPLGLLAPVVAGTYLKAANVKSFLTAGLSIARISSQKFEKGGVFDGPSHTRGGMPLIDPRTGRTVAELQGGEPILSRETYANNRPLVDKLLHASMHQGGAPIMAQGGTAPRRGNVTAPAPGTTPEQAMAPANMQNEQMLRTLDAILVAVGRWPKEVTGRWVYSEFERARDRIQRDEREASF